MMAAFTTDQITEIEHSIIKNAGLSEVVLMENAGAELARIAAKHTKANSRIFIYCGGGKNGGDGFVAARHLITKGFKPVVVCLKPTRSLKGLVLKNFQILKFIKCAIVGFKERGKLKIEKNDLIIDAILGIGLRGNVSELYSRAIEEINYSGCKVISADIPSGVDAETGKAHKVAVKADITLCMGSIKKGLLKNAAQKYVGKVVIADIGIPFKKYRRQNAVLSKIANFAYLNK